jgi:hypothetical protein
MYPSLMGWAVAACLLFPWIGLQAQPPSQPTVLAVYGRFKRTEQPSSGLELLAGTQFPIQNRLGMGWTHGRISLYTTYGLLSRAYVNIALNIQKRRQPDQTANYNFIRSAFEQGRVWEWGFRYRFNPLYVGIFLQSQKFAIAATPQALIENLAPEKAADIQRRADNFSRRVPAVGNFYESTGIRPTVYPTQLAFALGRHWHLGKSRQLGLGAEVAYSLNLYTASRVTSDKRSLVTNFLLENVNPVVEKVLQQRFKHFNVPLLSVALVYRLQPVHTR